jgi:hypothetical protein
LIAHVSDIIGLGPLADHSGLPAGIDVKSFSPRRLLAPAHRRIRDIDESKTALRVLKRFETF